jgi:hypothetical protein
MQNLATSFSEDIVLQERLTEGTVSVLAHIARTYKPC